MEELIKNPAIILALLGFIVYLIRLLLSNKVIEDYKKKENFLNMIYLSYSGIDDLEKDTSCTSIGLNCSMLALVFFIVGIIFKAYYANTIGNLFFIASLIAFGMSAILYIKCLKNKKYISLFIVLSIINIGLFILLTIEYLPIMLIINIGLFILLIIGYLPILLIIIEYLRISRNSDIAMNRPTDTTIYIFIIVLSFALLILYRERYIEYSIQKLKDKKINVELFFGEESFKINTENIDINHNYIRMLDNGDYVTLKIEDISKIEVNN